MIRRRTGILLRDARHKAGLSIADAANLSHGYIGRSLWGHVETGLRRPPGVDATLISLRRLGASIERERLVAVDAAEDLAWRLTEFPPVGLWLIQVILWEGEKLARENRSSEFQFLAWDEPVTIFDILNDPSLQPKKGPAAKKTYTTPEPGNPDTWPRLAAIDFLVSACQTIAWDFRHNETSALISTPWGDMTVSTKFDDPEAYAADLFDNWREFD